MTSPVRTSKSQQERHLETSPVASASDFKAKALIDEIERELHQNGRKLVETVKAVYCLKVLSGDKVGVWVVDVKNGSGSVRFDPEGSGDVTFTMDDDNWVKMLTNDLNPQEAYFRGHMKISGNVGLAMKLQSVLAPRNLKSKL